ncbi:MAG: tRNA pseudouridine(13) synthase TruD [Polyangiaceae bacterium]
MNTNVHEPLHATAEFGATGGAIGGEPEDFQVEEIPAYLPTGSGEHVYVQLRKRRLSTQDLVRRVAELAGVDARDIGYAGLKDKHAITSQWLSLPGRSTPPSSWSLPSDIELLQESRHNNKLRTGHLKGNRFRITLKGVDAGALERAQSILERLQQIGVPNYFGAQRFGRGAQNLARALDFLASGGRIRVSSFLLKLYPSVFQSEVFNRYLSLRREDSLDCLFNGEVVRLEGSSASFVVEDAERELTRLAAREIHLLGPMLGPKMRPASGHVQELETRAFESLGVAPQTLEVLGRFAPGARRDLLVFPEQPSLTAPSADSLLLEFSLPAGSYATVLVRELTKAPLVGADDLERDT